MEKSRYPYLLLMNIEQIFELFSSNEDSADSTYMSFDQHPYYNIGMFKKLILNNTNYNYNLSLSLHKQNPDWSVDDILDLGENILFNRAYSYISQFDIENSLHKEILDTFADHILLKCLEITIKHYEASEEYEKCAFLNRIKLQVVEFL